MADQYFVGPLVPSFRLWMTLPIGFKARVDAPLPALFTNDSQSHFLPGGARSGDHPHADRERYR